MTERIYVIIHDVLNENQTILLSKRLYVTNKRENVIGRYVCYCQNKYNKYYIEVWEPQTGFLDGILNDKFELQDSFIEKLFKDN